MDHASWLQYEKRIEEVKRTEYPALNGITYLDHAGTTPVPKSLIERFSADMVSNLYGNPHSASTSSQLSTRGIEDIRHDALRFFNADPAHFDLVFVANATAGIKLVLDAFRDNKEGFWYGYHKDSHTSLVGGRELAASGSRCFASDEEVEQWLQDSNVEKGPRLQLLAYPAQSNMNGRRLPYRWCRQLRDTANRTKGMAYSLLDAASLVSTTPLDLSDRDSAPDFTVLSFYKIFGFPDLGALIVRKQAVDRLRRRKYFGGGTVDMVVCLKEQWHAKKCGPIHQTLEDGTLPIHSILALRHAMDVHQKLFGSTANVSQHTTKLAQVLEEELRRLRHGNGVALCQLYQDDKSAYEDSTTKGPIIAFNMRDAHNSWISNSEVEKVAAVRNIQIRTGGLCNPGGIASYIGLEPWEMKENFSAGQRCDNDNDTIGGKPTGMIRASFGAMSTSNDVYTFVNFLREFFLETEAIDLPISNETLVQSSREGDFYVEALSIYPIKSCGAWKIPSGVSWDVKQEGLAWGREWCPVHQVTGKALNQKQHPKMTLIRPSLGLNAGLLRIKYTGHPSVSSSLPDEVTVPLSADPRVYETDTTNDFQLQDSTVCGEQISAKVYTSAALSEYFTSALGVPCQLARFPPNSAGTSIRHAKSHLRIPSSARAHIDNLPRPLLLSSESPILTISRSSLNRLNEQIKSRHGKAAQAEVFRANIVVAQNLGLVPGNEQPYAEDHWTQLDIGGHRYEVLGPCRRCQMVCVDQQTAEKDEEPFVTLAKTRRREGKVRFGMHTCVQEGQGGARTKVGDKVKAFVDCMDVDEG